MTKDDLLEAAKKGNQDAIETAYFSSDNFSLRDPCGYTLLHFVAENNDKDMVPVVLSGFRGLLNEILDATTFREGYTALHLACKKGHEEVVNQLIDKMANPTIQTSTGRTAAHLVPRSQKGLRALMTDYESWWTRNKLP